MPATLATEYYKVGSFWTAKQRQGHSLHEISYRACFKPQLPSYFIDRYTSVGDIVLDPFMGRGTTALQASLAQRVAYGSDINPLSTILVAPRLNPPHLCTIETVLGTMPQTANIPDEHHKLLTFFHRQTLSRLVAIQHWFAEKEMNNTMTGIDRWIRMVILNRLSGHSGGFLSVKTMPPNQAVSIEKQAQINEKYNRTPEPKDLADIVMRKSKSLLRSGYPPASDKHKLRCCRADDLNYIKTGEVKLVVTSPPFLDIVDYAKDNWLRCWFAGIDPNKVKIDCHSTIKKWREFVRRVFMEFARVVMPGGHVAFEVGEVRKGKLLLDEEVLKSIVGLPFELVEVLINQQEFTKTSNCWGISNNKSGTLTNRIVVAQRK